MGKDYILSTTATNQKKNTALALYEKKERERTGLFILEGPSEISMALTAGIEFVTVYFCHEFLDSDTKPLLANLKAEKIEVDKKLFERIAYRGTVSGIWAVARQPENLLADFKPGSDPLLLLVEKVEKPGNLGAILRTADAAGVKAVFVTEGLTDLYNPNIVRSSLGAVFSVPVFSMANPEALAWLQRNNINIFAATPSGAAEHTTVSYAGGVVIAIGSEKDGLSNFWLENCDRKILIPMRGRVNSLNASVSAAILIYEAVRQRSGK
jgi:TrmH family RNA methyltransferase